MNILIKPVITEKSKNKSQAGKFTFAVADDANKHQIKRAVEGTFAVNVRDIKTVKLAGKTRRFGRFTKKLEDRKKAIVILEKGQSIDLFITEKKKKVVGNK